MMNVEDEINKLGFELLTLLTVEENEPPKKRDSESKFSESEGDFVYGENKTGFIGGAVELGCFQIKEGTFFEGSQRDIFDNIVGVSAIINGKTINIDIDSYPKLLEIVELFLSIKFFSDNADLKFLEKSIFKWVIDVYTKSRAEFELYNFVQNRTEKELGDYTFYFKIVNLEIQEHFTIGNCEFTSLKKDYFINYFDSLIKETDALVEENRNDFIEMHKDFIDKVLIAATVKGVKEKAQSQAKREAELSVNAVKCYLGIESLKPNTELFNVDFNYMNNDVSEFISTRTDSNSLSLHQAGKNSPSPIAIDKPKLESLNKDGLELMSIFLQNKRDTELYYEILGMITELGNLHSTMKLYDRVLLLISFFERIVIPKSSTKGRGLTILKSNIIPKIISNSDEIISRFIKMYNVRDKYIHNRIELPFDATDLFIIKEAARLFLNQLIILSSKYSTIEDIHIHYKIISVKETV